MSNNPCLIQAYQLTVRRRTGKPMSVVMVNKARAIRCLALWSCHHNVVSVAIQVCTVGVDGRVIAA